MSGEPWNPISFFHYNLGILALPYQCLCYFLICRVLQRRTDHGHKYSMRFSEGRMSKVSPLVFDPTITNPDSKKSRPSKSDAAMNEMPKPKRLLNTATDGGDIQQFFKSRLAFKLNKNQAKGSETCNRLLVTINVLGSPGPLRFLMNSNDPVHKLIKAALKCYAQQRRLPLFGHNVYQFELHCANTGSGQALELSQMIGVLGTRNFLLCKKKEAKAEQGEEKVRSRFNHEDKKKLWKIMLSTSLGFLISSH